MSAIVAGTCKKCNKKFNISLGHPKWYDDVTKRGKPKGEMFLAFQAWTRSGECNQCYEPPEEENEH